MQDARRGNITSVYVAVAYYDDKTSAGFKQSASAQ